MTTPLGKYKLVKLIASGGMAEVYLAKQAGAAGFEKLVCLKRILPHLARDKQFVDMFLNEARLAAQLDHPNIVSIFDLGETNGNYFIAMEFIDGPNLRSVAKRAAELGELLPIPEVCKIISMAASGLQYAHDLADSNGTPLGLVHRDVSPDNILVHRNGSAKVVDFGIAKAANSAGATRTGTLKGKVAYMPPEQLRGEPLDRRTDVFALGVVMYEMLGGKRPWEGDSEVALIGKIMTEEPQPLSELRPDVPPELVGIVDKALAKERSLRYQNCIEMQADLEQLIVGMGQTVTPSRIADFVRAYLPAESAAEPTDASLLSVEEESFAGTGAAPSILLADSRAKAASDPGTMLIEASATPPQKGGRGLLYGIAAFAAIAIIGGGAGWFVLRSESGDDLAQPVAVERATVVQAPRPPSPPTVVKAPEPASEPQAQPAQQAQQVPQTQQAQDSKPKQHRIARVDPLPPPVAAPPVVVVKETPPPPPPVVVAKGELVLFVRPWAKVEIDSHEIGVTPLPDPIKLAAGDHQVRLINPDLGKDITRTVHITAGAREELKEILDE